MGKRSGIGLDIGSSAVRAAEVFFEEDRRVLRRFGQVGLPPGAVVEGEVREAAVVAAAIRRLWAEAGFSRREAVLGLGSQRAMVRQVEMPAVGDQELRSALGYKIGEYLPIPVDQAVFDFVPLRDAAPVAGGGDGAAGDPEPPSDTLLLVAAQRETVAEQLEVVRTGGVRVRAVDVSPLALLRATAEPGTRGTGLEAVVSFGAQLVVVAVRDGGVPRFVRTVTAGGSSITDGLSEQFSLSRERAEHLKRSGGGGEGSLRAAVVARLEPIVTEVTSSLEFFLSQTKHSQYDRVIVTGGAALLPGFTESLSTALGTPVAVGMPTIEVDEVALGLSPEQLEGAHLRWVTAVGLALWEAEPAAPSLILRELVAQRRQRRQLAALAAGVGLLALALAGVSATKVLQAHREEATIRSDTAQAARLQVRVNHLESVTAIRGQVTARRALAAAALNGDIGWVALQGRILAALPAGVELKSIAYSTTQAGTPPASAPPAAPGSAPTAVTEGAVNIEAVSTLGSAEVSAFIRQEDKVAGMGRLWVSASQPGPGGITFSATAVLTPAALSSRSADLPGGSK